MRTELVKERLSAQPAKQFCRSIILAALVLVSAVESIDAQNIESVYLKNGSIIKGDVTEYNIGQDIKMETAGGSLVLPYDDVIKIVKEGAEQPSLNADAIFKPRYEGGLNLSASIGLFGPGVGMVTSHGCLVIPQLYVGAGLGVYYYFDYEAFVSLPVFAEVKGYFTTDTSVRPYARVRLGYETLLNSYYLGSSIGLKYKKLDVSVGVSSASLLVNNLVVELGIRF